jgi:putative transposase
MPRAPRTFIDGAIYHVYGRISRGEHVFAEPREAAHFAAVIADVTRRDGLTVLAWCIMANHYHLALRTGAVPLWRSVRLIQWRFARQLNRRRRQFGPVWQGRYHAKLVEDERYLLQLIAYVHLNPVAAGLVDEPATYPWSGHREMLRTKTAPLVDAGASLALFGRTTSGARRAYVRSLRGSREATWVGERPGRLPWWGRADRDDDLAAAWDQSMGDVTRTHVPRVRVQDGAAYVSAAATALGVAVAELAGRGKAPDVVRAREVLALVGVERFGVRVNELAARLGMQPGSVSRWLGRGATRRTDDPSFARRCLDLERAVAHRLGLPTS